MTYSESPPGYFGSIAYKSMRGAAWRTLTLLSATFYPGVVFALFFLLNLFIWGEASSGAVSYVQSYSDLLRATQTYTDLL